MAKTDPRWAGTLVDTSVVSDILQEDEVWSGWSRSALADAGNRGDVVYNQLVYAELAPAFESPDQLDRAIPGFLKKEDLPWEASFPAFRCFLAYRRAGGTKRSPLPDFYIAAHATVKGYALLTRDRPRYAEYLPELHVICPEDTSA